MRRALPILLIAFLLSCEKHPAKPAVERFVEALRYGDVERLYDLHVDSTESTRWCSGEFRAALEKARDNIDSEQCQRLRALTTSDLEAMKDELRLAVQLSGWVCEHPDGDCQGYAETVFRQAIRSHPLVEQKPQSITIRKVFGDEAHAAAYLDIVDASGETSHRTLELEQVSGAWHVSAGLFDAPPRTPQKP